MLDRADVHDGLVALVLVPGHRQVQVVAKLRPRIEVVERGDVTEAARLEHLLKVGIGEVRRQLLLFERSTAAAAGLLNRLKPDLEERLREESGDLEYLSVQGDVAYEDRHGQAMLVPAARSV